MHDALTVGILVLAILAGILLNQRGRDKLEARLDGRINSLAARLDRMQFEFSARLLTGCGLISRCSTAFSVNTAPTSTI
jgi:hypothetical protein